jgi:hypothetical protein
MAIDTLGYSEYLEQHGVPRDQARAHAAAANQFLFPQLATKADLVELKSELTMRVLAIVGLLNGTLFALIKLT